MTHGRSVAVSSLLLSLILPPALKAQGEYTLNEITLEIRLSNLNPYVHSYARSILYRQNVRVYDQQLILAHQISDEGAIIWNLEFVSDIGYASSSTEIAGGDPPGIPEHCYQARMASHVNAFNLHSTLYSAPQCAPSRPGPPEKPPKENCPVLLDLEQNGFHLSGAEPPVNFDIDADGRPDRIAWTRAGEDDAFLCLDRNHNGMIDDGAELFGYATPLLSGRPARIGYRALAELDLPALGGNSDGRIDAQDQQFSDLCAWVDRNRNGISEPAEVFSLDQVGVAALDFSYATLHLVDPFGNWFRYASRVKMRSPAGSENWWPTYDVIFAQAH